MLAPANFFRVGQTLAYKQLNKQIPNFLGICLSNTPPGTTKRRTCDSTSNKFRKSETASPKR